MGMEWTRSGMKVIPVSCKRPLSVYMIWSKNVFVLGWFHTGAEDRDEIIPGRTHFCSKACKHSKVNDQTPRWKSSRDEMQVVPGWNNSCKRRLRGLASIIKKIRQPHDSSEDFNVVYFWMTLLTVQSKTHYTSLLKAEVKVVTPSVHSEIRIRPDLSTRESNWSCRRNICSENLLSLRNSI